MRRGKLGIAVMAAAAALLSVGVSVGVAGGRVTDGGSATAGIDFGSALVELKGAPLSTYEKTKPPQGKKIDFSSATVKSYRAQLSVLRNEFKQWLQKNAKSARVTGEFDISLNAVAVALNGTSLGTIAAAPMVQAAQYQGVYTPQVIDPDLTLINAFASWGAGGAPNAGAGVKVAIIDSGIDASHPCFGTGGTNGGTNAKVIFAGVFHNKAANQGYTPADENGHGTHVAGTVACQYGLTNATTIVDGATVGYGVLGVAPAARLGNFNVFPDSVANARSEDILNALESAYAQGFDVANMSLGGGSHGIQDLLMKAVNDLDRAGMISAVAAGNAGPGLNTVESPGAAERALTAGMVSVGHFVGDPVTNGGATYGAMPGDFETVGADLTADLAKVEGGTGTACTPLAAGSLTGKIALISRGVCTFTTKVRNAQAAGAAAVLIRNNQFGGPIPMGQDGTLPVPTTPAYMVSMADGNALIASASVSTTIDSSAEYFQNAADNDYLDTGSGRGPTDVDFRVKPDVTAPGVNVLSSQPSAACSTPPCWAFFTGTSMATPHLAGSAAVVIGQHPNWSTAQVRSAIVNTADTGTVKDPVTNTVISNVNLVGSGRENLDQAVDAVVGLDPVSVSFGGVPSGSGRTDLRTVSLSNLGGAGGYSATVTGENCAPLVDFSASVSGMMATVTMSAQKLQGAALCQGVLRISNAGGEVAHAAVFALIK
jgi:minor extracellular serine protease Vpr